MKSNANDIRDEIQKIDSLVYKLSDMIAGDIEWDGLCPQYLSGKVAQLSNTVNHVKGQLKYKKKS